MKKQLLAIAAALGAITLGGSARATMVAGWDFSQYLGDGTYVVDDGSLFEFVDTLGANYSSLLPNGLGPAAGAYGTLYVGGQFGSTDQQVGSGAETFLPSFSPPGGSLGSNLTAPVVDGFLNPFDTWTNLQLEGQVNAVALAMTALGSSSAVFAATPGQGGTDWLITFGARTQSGASTLGIEFSTDGSSYAPIQQIALSAVDTAYSMTLPAGLTPTAFVRFVFDVDGASAPVIDNVAISATLVPEPGTIFLLVSGIVGLFVHGRHRA
jgi:hypothetical protein